MTFSPLTLTLDSNTALAPLLTLAATGATLNGATLVGVNDAGQQVYLDLANVSVTNVEHHADSSTEPVPMLTLRYGQIELETFSGRHGQPVAGAGASPAWTDGRRRRGPDPVTYFMLIDEVNGGSQDAQHKGWFEIKGFDLDLAHATVLGGGTAAADFSPLNVTLPHETRLADVMTLLATGELVTGVRIEGVTARRRAGQGLRSHPRRCGGDQGRRRRRRRHSLSLDYGKIALSPRASMQPASQPRTARSATTSSTTSRSTRSRWP